MTGARACLHGERLCADMQALCRHLSRPLCTVVATMRLHRGSKGQLPSRAHGSAAGRAPAQGVSVARSARALHFEEPLGPMVPRLPHPARPPEHRVLGPRVAKVLGLHVDDVRPRREGCRERSRKPVQTALTAWSR